MKKVFLVLALVATYGVSMAMSGSDMKSVNTDQVTIVADVDDNSNVAEPEKEKAKTKEAKAAKSEAKSTAKSEGCATAKSEGCATAKSEGCGGDKAKAKKDDAK
jgi:flagellar biosynthesis/type III secretory pathway protein FliH